MGEKKENNCINYQWKQSLPWQSSLSALLLKDQYILTLIRLVCSCREFQQEEGQEILCLPIGRKSPAAEIAPRGLRPFTLIDQRKKLLLGITWLPRPSFSGVTRPPLPPTECPAYILTRLIFSWEVVSAAWILSCFSHCPGRAEHDHLHRTSQCNHSKAAGLPSLIFGAGKQEHESALYRFPGLIQREIALIVHWS